MRIITAYILGSVVFLGLIGPGGCSDDAEHKAAKQVRLGSKKAVEVFRRTGDAQTARKELTTALARGQPASPAGATAVFINANLMLAEAESAFGGPQQTAARRAKALALADEISVALTQMEQLKRDKMLLEQVRVARKAELAGLNNALERTQGALGPLESQLQQLQQQKHTLELQVADLSSQADQLQQQAHSLFRQAELASGDQQTELEEQAYDLLLGRTAGQLGSANLGAAVQNGLDRVRDIEQQIQVLNRRYERLSGDAAALQRRIRDVETASSTKELDGKLADVDTQLNRHQQIALERAGLIIDSEKQYLQEAEQVVQMLSAAGEEYQKAGTTLQTVAPAVAKLAAADCSYRIGFSLAEHMGFYEQLGGRLAVCAVRAEKTCADTLATFAKQCQQKAADFGARAMESYARTAESYQALCQRLQGDRGELAGAAVKNYILTLTELARLAEKRGDDNTDSQTLATATGLLGQAVDCDPQFADSITAGLLRQLDPNLVIPAPQQPRIEAAPEPQRAGQETPAAPAEEPAGPAVDVNSPLRRSPLPGGQDVRPTIR